jgi:hypothetical protein
MNFWKGVFVWLSSSASVLVRGSCQFLLTLNRLLV